MQFEKFLEFSFLTIFPCLYLNMIGLSLTKILPLKEINANKVIFAPALGILLCTILHIILLKKDLLQFGNQTYLILGMISIVFFPVSELIKYISNWHNINKICFCLLITFFVYLFQKITIAWNYTPLKYIPENGFGMDDTAFHAAISGAFLKQMPLQNPFLRSEFLESSHYMVHSLGAFLSCLTSRSPLDIFLYSIPFLVIFSLVIQSFYFLNHTKKKGIILSGIGSLSVCLGLNGLFLLYPFLSEKIITNAPEPLSFIFWRLPGLGFSFLFLIPMVILLANIKINLSKKNIFLCITFLFLLAGNLYSKPIAGCCILIAAIFLINLKNSFKSKFGYIICFLIICFSGLLGIFYLSSTDYSLGVKTSFDPFKTVIQVFGKSLDLSLQNKNNLTFIIFILSSYFILPLLSALFFLKNPKKLDKMCKILIFSSLCGLIVFFLINSPMTAEYQFGIYAYFSGTLAFFASQTENKKITCFTIVFFISSFSFYLAQINKKMFLYDKFSGAREVNKDKVLAMDWLKKNSQRNDAFFINNQHYRNKKTNNAVFSALSERQSYISCFQYTPRTYIYQAYGHQSSWDQRIINNREIFNGNSHLLKSLAQKYNIKYLVLDRTALEKSYPLPPFDAICVYKNDTISILQINK